MYPGGAPMGGAVMPCANMGGAGMPCIGIGGAIMTGMPGGGAATAWGGASACTTAPGACAKCVCGRLPPFCSLRAAASNLSAGVPCRSPRDSFLNAYDTLMARPARYCPSIASMAASLASKLS